MTEYVLSTAGYGSNDPTGQSAQSQSEQQGEPASAANVSISNVSMPSKPRQGSTATASVTVSNNANLISPFDQDYCNSNSIGGYNLTVTVIFGSPRASKSKCVTTHTPQTFSLDFTAPKAGYWNYKITVKGKTSGRQVATKTGSMYIRPPKSSGSGGSSGGSPPSGNCSPPSGGCPSGQTFDYSKCQCAKSSQVSFLNSLSQNTKLAAAAAGGIGLLLFTQTGKQNG